MIRSELSCAQVVREIGADNVSGASELSRKAASSFVLFASENPADSGQEYFRGLSELGAKLILAQPHMASIFNVVNSILYSVEQSLPALGGDELADFTREKAQEFIANSLSAVQLIAENGEGLIAEGSRILTFSASGSILAILKKAKEMGRNFKVVAAESRPMFEGRLLARFLGNARIPVTLIADAAMGTFAKDADIFLVGADSVSESSFVNKVGTLYLCLLSREYHVPLYVACERSKFISGQWRPSPHAGGDPGEILDSELLNVKAENPYFEEIPLSFCRQLITNEGFFSPSDVPRYIRKTRLCRDLMERMKDLRRSAPR
jgi:translation initiation factor 2B subunit (eIF-2B alpha/beta/delta family)